MFQKALKKVFGDRNQRLLNKLSKTVNEINALEAGLQTLSDQELSARTADFKQRIAGGANRDDLLAEVFAVVREVSVRTLGFTAFRCSVDWRYGVE